MKSVFLENIHHAYAQTDGTYAFPNSREGDMLKRAKMEIERLTRELSAAACGLTLDSMAYQRLSAFINGENVKEHAPSPAAACVDNRVDGVTTGEHENRAAGDGCRVSSCSLLLIMGALDLTQASYLALGLVTLALVLWLAWKLWHLLDDWSLLKMWKVAAHLFALAFLLQTVTTCRLYQQLSLPPKKLQPTSQSAPHVQPRSSSPYDGVPNRYDPPLSDSSHDDQEALETQRDPSNEEPFEQSLSEAVHLSISGGLVSSVLSLEDPYLHSLANDERMHHYQRRRTSITGLVL